MGLGTGQRLLGRRREAVRPVEGEDPYADYLAWVADGRPALVVADLMAQTALPMPAADDAPEDAPAPPARRGRHSGPPAG